MYSLGVLSLSESELSDTVSSEHWLLSTGSGKIELRKKRNIPGAEHKKSTINPINNPILHGYTPTVLHDRFSFKRPSQIINDETLQISTKDKYQS